MIHSLVVCICSRSRKTKAQNILVNYHNSLMNVGKMVQYICIYEMYTLKKGENKKYSNRLVYVLISGEHTGETGTRKYGIGAVRRFEDIHHIHL